MMIKSSFGKQSSFIALLFHKEFIGDVLEVSACLRMFAAGSGENYFNVF